MFVLDTNVISELRAGKPMPSVSVRHWAGQVPANQLYLAAVTVLELEIGVLAMERKDSRQGRILRSWLQGCHQGILLAGSTFHRIDGHSLRGDARPEPALEPGCNDRSYGRRAWLYGCNPRHGRL